MLDIKIQRDTDTQGYTVGRIVLDGEPLGAVATLGSAISLGQCLIYEKVKPVSYCHSQDGYKYRTLKGHYPVRVYPTKELAEAARDEHFAKMARQYQVTIERQWPVIIEGKQPAPPMGRLAEYAGPLPADHPQAAKPQTKPQTPLNPFA